MKPRKDTGTDLVAFNGSTEVSLPTDLAEAARGYARSAMAKNTITMYTFWWKDYTAWCHEVGRQPIPDDPATHVETIVGYVTWLAQGRGGKRAGLSRASIEQALAAIKRAARAAAMPVDDKHPMLQEVLRGIRREIAKSRTTRKVRPLMGEDVRDLLQFFDPLIPREARNRALIGIGFGAALRRSEIVGLDWIKPGSKKDEARVGFATPDATGITITLMSTKASQDEAQTVVIPRADAPLICAAIEDWARVRGIASGEPLFPGSLVGSGFGSKLYAGVSWKAKEKKWLAQIRRTDIIGKAYKQLGQFDTIEEAAAAIVKAGGKKVARHATTRLPAGYVAVIIKGAVKKLLQSRTGRKRISAAEVKQAVAQYSGHSMRAGHVTDAFERGVPQHHIKQQSRHKSDGILSGYARAISKVKNNSLRGSGL